MKTKMIVGAAALLVAGTASAALVGGFDQRYVADDFGATTAGVWDEAVSGQDATAVGTFTTTTTPNGSAAVLNTGAGTSMDFTRAAAVGGAGYTIQAVIRIDEGNGDFRQSPIGMDDGGWGGAYMGARVEADGNVRLRGGNQNGSDGATVLQIDDTMVGVTDGTWGIYTLVVATADTPTMVASFDRLSDGVNLFTTFTDVGLDTDVGQIGAAGRLFGGEMGGAITETDAWLGAIAEVVVYDSALSTAEASQNGLEFYNTYQIPEPATLGLIAAFGGGLMFIRRRFSM